MTFKEEEFVELIYLIIFCSVITSMFIIFLGLSVS